MATLETSLEAYYDKQTYGRKKLLIGKRATVLPKNHNQLIIQSHLKSGKQNLAYKGTKIIKFCNFFAVPKSTLYKEKT